MKMSVKELRELIRDYEDDRMVEIEGGEDSYGEWAAFSIISRGCENDCLPRYDLRIEE